MFRLLVKRILVSNNSVGYMKNNAVHHSCPAVLVRMSNRNSRLAR